MCVLDICILILTASCYSYMLYVFCNFGVIFHPQVTSCATSIYSSYRDHPHTVLLLLHPPT